MHLRSLAFACALAAAPATSLAQFNSSIEGTVLDRSGAVIPNAAVTVTNAATGVAREITTSSDGLYRVLDLGLGQYNVTVRHEGFRSAEQRGIDLAANATVRANITLDVGGAGEKVTVEAEIPRVETEQGRVSGRIETQELKELPLNGRNLYSLLALQPGVSGRGLAATFGAGGGGANNDGFAAENQPEIYASGQRVESNSYLLDDSSVNSAARGGVANLTPNPDSVAEVRVVSNNFSAVNGRSSGGQVEMITKSGTNAFHGGATEFFQNNTIADRNEFEASVPVFRRNEFGSVITSAARSSATGPSSLLPLTGSGSRELGRRSIAWRLRRSGTMSLLLILVASRPNSSLSSNLLLTRLTISGRSLTPRPASQASLLLKDFRRLGASHLLRPPTATASNSTGASITSCAPAKTRYTAHFTGPGRKPSTAGSVRSSTGQAMNTERSSA